MFTPPVVSTSSHSFGTSTDSTPVLFSTRVVTTCGADTATGGSDDVVVDDDVVVASAVVVVAGQIAVGVKLNDRSTASSTSSSSGPTSLTITTTVTSSVAGLATTTWNSAWRDGPQSVYLHHWPKNAPSSYGSTSSLAQSEGGS